MEVGIAREVAVQHGSTSITQAAGTATERLGALTPVVSVAADAPQAQPAGDGQPETKAMLESERTELANVRETLATL